MNPQSSGAFAFFTGGAPQKVLRFLGILFLLLSLCAAPALSQDLVDPGQEDAPRLLASADQEGSGPSGKEEHEGGGHAGMNPLFFVILALLIGAATRHFLKKSPLPYTVTLLLIGLLLGVLDRVGLFSEFSGTLSHAVEWAGRIDPHLILYVFLPTLIFEAAFALDVHTFKKTVTNAFLMAVPGILISVFLTAGLAIGIQQAGLGLTEWSWGLALLFGAIVSATDPVAVVSLLKELGASKKLGTLIEGESLLNDGTAIVIFMVSLSIVEPQFAGDAEQASTSGGGGSVVVEFLRVALGGVLMGAVIGGVTTAWVKRVFNDAMVEISVIVAAAYLTFYIAEGFFHVSGVLGLVALGLVMASVGKTRISPQVDHFLHEFWELAAFIANTLIFIICGVVIAERTVFTANDFLLLALFYIGVFIIRGIVISLFYPLMKRIGYGLPKKDAYVLWWGALRGAIGLAMALVVAGNEYIPEPIKQQFMFFTAGLVMLTLLINATTIGWLVNKLGLTEIPPAKAVMMFNARQYLRQSTENAMEKTKQDRFMSRANWKKVEDYLPARPDHLKAEEKEVETIAETRRRILEKEKSSYWHQFKDGLLGSDSVHILTDAVNDMLDRGGRISLADRGDLEELWNTPKLLNKVQNWPFVGKIAERMFFERLATSYDCARGFVVAQEEALKLIESMHRQKDETYDSEEEREKLLSQMEGEINENRIHGLTFLRNLRKKYPEIYTAIATREAIRSMLNYELRTVDRLLKKGRVEQDEAENMKASIEERMKRLMNTPPSIDLPKNEELLRELSWLRDTDPRTFEKIAGMFHSKVHAVGEHLIKEGEKRDGICVIARGTVKVTVGEEVMEVLGSGSVLGEISVLTGTPSNATITADSPVTALWIGTGDLRKAMRMAPSLEDGLWKIAGKRIAENLLRDIHPYNLMSKKRFRRWLNEGQVLKGKEADSNMAQSICVLITGEAYKTSKGKYTIASPAVLDDQAVEFSEDARFLMCDSRELEDLVSADQEAGSD